VKCDRSMEEKRKPLSKRKTKARVTGKKREEKTHKQGWRGYCTTRVEGLRKVTEKKVRRAADQIYIGDSERGGRKIPETEEKSASKRGEENENPFDLEKLWRTTHEAA